MIVRMTVGDNDFTNQIEYFCKDFWKDLLFRQDDNYESMSAEEKLNWWKDHRDFQDMLNPNNEDTLDNSRRELVCKEIVKLWNTYVDSHQMGYSCCDDDHETHIKEYLKQHFKVQILYRMFDKWENGEVVYFFTTNEKFVTQ